MDEKKKDLDQTLARFFGDDKADTKQIDLAMAYAHRSGRRSIFGGLRNSLQNLKNKPKKDKE
jgi:hypothetical protein